MKVSLKNWKGRVSLVEVPDTTEKLSIIEVSGDQVMVFPVFFDTGSDTRVEGFFDQHAIFSIDKLETFEIGGETRVIVPDNHKWEEVKDE